MKQKKASLSTVLCTQKFRGLPKMVKNPFWYKKYKYINCLRRQLSFYVSCILAIIESIFQSSIKYFTVTTAPQMLSIELLENVQNNGRLLLTFNIYKVLISKNGKRKYSTFISFALCFPKILKSLFLEI